MTRTAVSSIEPTIHTTNAWLKQIAEEIGKDDRSDAYRALRAVLHALRDRLTVDEAAQFAAQLPATAGEFLSRVVRDGRLHGLCGGPRSPCATRSERPSTSGRFAVSCSIALPSRQPKRAASSMRSRPARRCRRCCSRRRSRAAGSASSTRLCATHGRARLRGLVTRGKVPMLLLRIGHAEASPRASRCAVGDVLEVVAASSF